MTNPAGESNGEALRFDFDRRLTLQFRGWVVTSDVGLLAYREADDALRLSAIAGEDLADARDGKNGRHALVGMSHAEYDDCFNSRLRAVANAPVLTHFGKLGRIANRHSA